MTILAVLAAAVMAVCYGTASVLQAIGVRSGAPSAGLDPGLLVRMLRQLPYLAGLALDGAGFLASLLALRHLPLFLVQAAAAAGVGITALLATRLLALRLSGRDVVALFALGAGVVLLAISARPESSADPGSTFGWVVLILLAPTLVSALLAPHAGSHAPAMLAAVAGSAFSGVAIAARGVMVPHPWWHLVGKPLAWSVVGYGVLGAWVFAAALERGAVTAVTAVVFAVETVLPASVGLHWLGDSTRSGMALPAVVGFGITLAAAVGLAGYAQPTAPG
ncbi:MAG TPA: hypothetical protein VGJ14_16415 [Sporichthyaceae bacterium]